MDKKTHRLTTTDVSAYGSTEGKTNIHTSISQVGNCYS